MDVKDILICSPFSRANSFQEWCLRLGNAGTDVSLVPFLSAPAWVAFLPTRATEMAMTVNCGRKYL